MPPARPASEYRPAEPECAWTLPSRYYYDDAIYRRELQTIFHSAWHCVGHRSELAEAGAFVRLDVAEQSLIVLCDDGGALRAFHNVCQHRGTRLVSERRGNLGRVIRCPYHAWAYNLDGALRHAPRCERVAGFDVGDVRLAPVRVETWAGFVFVNMDAAAPALAEEVGDSRELLVRHFPDLDGLGLVDEVDFVVDANWKVVVDNEVEGYHFRRSGPVHRELARLIQFDRYEMVPRGKWWYFQGPPAPGLTHAFGEAIGDARYQTDWFFNIQFWPHTTLYAFPYADFVGTFNQFPLGPEQTLLRLGYYRPSRPESTVSKACMRWMSEELGPEDIALNVAQQKGLRSLGFDQGRLMIDAERSADSEHLVHHFHTLVHAALQRNTADDSARD